MENISDAKEVALVPGRHPLYCGDCLSTENQASGTVSATKPSPSMTQGCHVSGTNAVPSLLSLFLSVNILKGYVALGCLY